MKSKKVKRKSIFNPEFYKILNLPHLSKQDIKRIIESFNKKIGYELANSQRGVDIPGIGTMVVVKNKPIKTLYSNRMKKTILHNNHSLGYTAAVSWRNREIGFLNKLWRYKPHRHNIKWKIADKITSGESDYIEGIFFTGRRKDGINKL